MRTTLWQKLLELVARSGDGVSDLNAWAVQTQAVMSKLEQESAIVEPPDGDGPGQIADALAEWRRIYENDIGSLRITSPHNARIHLRQIEGRIRDYADRRTIASEPECVECGFEPEGPMHGGIPGSHDFVSAKRNGGR